MRSHVALFLRNQFIFCPEELPFIITAASHCLEELGPKEIDQKDMLPGHATPQIILYGSPLHHL